MKFESIILVLVVIIAFVLCLSALNTFVGGSDIFAYISAPILFGMAVIGGGFFVSTYVKEHVS